MTGFDKFAATGAAAESPIAAPEKQGQLVCYAVTDSFKKINSCTSEIEVIKPPLL